MKKFTYQQLADAINALPASEKQKQVVILMEDEDVGKKVNGLGTTTDKA